MATAFGFRKSKLDGSEYMFATPAGSLGIPSKYNYKKYLPKVLDQGNRPICVPCSVSAFLNWRENLPTGSKKDNKINYEEIYSVKQIEGEGMTFKEAFSYLRHHGVDSKAGELKINEYAMITNPLALKYALFMNGPCVGALPVFNFNPEFWKKGSPYDELQGYHAIAIVGYEENSFIIRNSWGGSFGDKGYTKITDADFGKFLELWTIL